MTAAALLSLIACALCVYVAVLSMRMRHVPGWSEQGWFAVIALSGAVFTAGNLPSTWPVLGDQAVVWSSRLQIFVGGLEAALWLRYTNLVLGRRQRRWEWTLSGVVLAFGSVGLLSAAVFDGRVARSVHGGILYLYTPSTWFGDLALAVILGTLLVPLARYLAAWRAGTRHAAVHAIGIVGLLALTGSDALVVAGVIDLPLLADLGTIFPLSIVGLVLSERFVEDSKKLEGFHQRLETLVGERTLQLANRETALLRSEKLAALGRLAAGVAHEIAGPVAAATANLQYLAEGLRAGRVPVDGVEAVQESIESLQRVASTVRHLYDAGRISGRADPGDDVVDLGEAAGQAVAEACARLETDVPVDVRVAEGLAARGERRVVHEVLVSLLKNAVQAVEDGVEGGQVLVWGVRAGDRVRLSVEDNGVGMPAEALRQAFEPFFSTRPQGAGSGMGLAVSRGLVTSLGGDLSIESSPGRGTCVVLELPAARPLVSPARAAAS